MWFRVDASGDSCYMIAANGGATIINGVTGSTPIAFDAGLIVDSSYVESGSPEWQWRTGNVSRESGSSLGAPAAGDSTGSLSIGASPDGGNEGKFDVAEILIYSRVLTGTERSTIYSYMAARYGV